MQMLLIFCLEFPTDFAYKMIWVKNSLHVRVSDKSSLIFQTWRREESFNEDYRQIAVVTSGRGRPRGCRGGWSLIEHIVTPKGWVLIRDFQFSTDTTFNWKIPLLFQQNQCISFFNLSYESSSAYLKVFLDKSFSLLPLPFGLCYIFLHSHGLPPFNLSFTPFFCYPLFSKIEGNHGVSALFYCVWPYIWQLQSSNDGKHVRKYKEEVTSLFSQEVLLLPCCCLVWPQFLNDFLGSWMENRGGDYSACFAFWLLLTVCLCIHHLVPWQFPILRHQE